MQRDTDLKLAGLPKVRDRPEDALGPGVPGRLEEDLEKADLPLAEVGD